MKNQDLDKYSHKLSIKNKIAYEFAEEKLLNTIGRLKEKKYKSNNMVKSAYKYSRNRKLYSGGNIIKKYKINYIK